MLNGLHKKCRPFFLITIHWILMKYFILLLLSLSASAKVKLSDAIPYPFHEVQKTADGKNNELTILNSGIASLKLRLDMIRRAQNQIEVEYFIYGLDRSSKIITQELVLAAQRGVKVRILIDKSAAVFVFNEYYAKALSEKNIEVRYYNAAPLIQVSTIQFRNHRKLLSVDDKEAITGGRNLGDDYYDLSPKFNFIDTDVYVKGDIVSTMRKTFDAYFESNISEKPDFPKMPRNANIVSGTRNQNNAFKRLMKTYLEKTEAAKSFLVRTEQDENDIKKIDEIGEPILNNLKSHICPETTFTTDRPGATFINRLIEKYSDDYRFVRKTLYDKISTVDKSLLLVSPYMINNRYSHSLMDELLVNKVEINLYTNSLASTDAVYVAANLYLDINKWKKEGLNIHVHAGQYLNETPAFDDSIKNAKWGLHTKAHVYERSDSSEIMIGTYNIDNRSNHYNSEMAIFCKGNDELTSELKSSIQDRMREGLEITPDRSAIDKHGNKTSAMGIDPDNKLLMRLITLPSWFLKFLL